MFTLLFTICVDDLFTICVDEGVCVREKVCVMLCYVFLSYSRTIAHRANVFC